MKTNAEYRAQARAALRPVARRGFLLFFFSTALCEAFALRILIEHVFSVPRSFGWTLYGYEYRFEYAQPVGFGVALSCVVFALQLFYLIVRAGEYAVGARVLRGERADLRTMLPLKTAGRLLLMNLIRAILVSLGWLCFFFPGIVLMLSYSMADYLLIEHPEMSAVEALRESRARMNGSRLRYLSFLLSHIVWIVACVAALALAEKLLSGAGVAGEVIYAVLGWAVSAPFALYLTTGECAFFAGLETQRFETEARETPDAKDAPETAEAEPGAAEKAPAQDDSFARRLFVDHRCSRRLLREAGRLEEYEAARLPAFVEDGLRRDYAGSLMRRFDRDPDALDDLLALAGEYGMDDLTDRALSRIERYARERNIPDAEILNMLGRVMTLLTSGAFAENASFAVRKRAQILEVADRLGARLESEDIPEAQWRFTLDALRKM